MSTRKAESLAKIYRDSILSGDWIEVGSVVKEIRERIHAPLTQEGLDFLTKLYDTLEPHLGDMSGQLSEVVQGLSAEDIITTRIFSRWESLL